MNTKTNSQATGGKVSFSFTKALRLNKILNPTTSTIGIGMARRRLLTLQNTAGFGTTLPIPCLS